MHLIVLENEASSSRGGEELNLFEICRSLSQRGHNITLLYVKEGDLIEQYSKFCNQILKVNSYRFDRRKINEVFDFIAGIPVIWKIKTRNNSVVLSNNYYDIFFGYLVSIFKKLPLVCYFHIPPFDFNRQRLTGLNSVKQFIAVSNQTKLDWEAKLSFEDDKINVVHNGTNPEKFKPLGFSTIRKAWSIPENIIVISYVGRLDKPKGLETLIRAFALLVKSNSNTRLKLLIAGKPLLHFTEDGKECYEEGEKYKQSLEQLSIDLGIEEYVNFLGHVTNTPSLYQVSDVTVLPSKWPEPFGRVIIESMACGTPVVASRTGGIPEIMTGEFQNGLFEPENEQNLSDILNLIMNWRDKDPQLGERCRQHVLGKFSLDKMVDGVEKVLLKVVKE